MYIGNLAPDVGDAELQAAVAQFGRVLDVKVYRKGGYAFAQFAAHAEAVAAIVGLSGQNLGGKTLKCSWGRCVGHAGRPQSWHAWTAGHMRVRRLPVTPCSMLHSLLWLCVGGRGSLCDGPCCACWWAMTGVQQAAAWRASFS